MLLAEHPGDHIHTPSFCVDLSQVFPEQLVVEGSLIHQAARNRRQEVLFKCGTSVAHFYQMNELLKHYRGYEIRGIDS